MNPNGHLVVHIPVDAEFVSVAIDPHADWDFVSHANHLEALQWWLDREGE